jgi:hypothetical protein
LVGRELEKAFGGVGVHEFGAVVASLGLFSDVRKGSGSSPAAAQGASTTSFASVVATEAALFGEIGPAGNGAGLTASRPNVDALAVEIVETRERLAGFQRFAIGFTVEHPPAVP